MKRCAQRRNGENLADKLAYDIYTLISVLVEGDYGSPDLGNIISSRSRIASISTNPSTSARSTPVRLQSNPDRQTDCPIRAEFQALQETTTVLQAELLTLKQNICESISDENNQISELKEALQQISGLVHDLKQTVMGDLQDVSKTLSRIESVELNSLTQMKNELKIFKQDMKNCECSVDIIHNNFQNAVQKREKPKKKSSPKSVRSLPADRNVHDVTSTSSSITGREKHNHMLILDTVTETATGSATHVTRVSNLSLYQLC